ncbi:hypothetical protein AB6806_20900 [Bosea sp. RCC_152_1]|uniref:hypothetical protein n=1 Tax=Bosea sp. RCC_152_1 TaxID=3239228 RepID=UPI003524CC5A
MAQVEAAPDIITMPELAARLESASGAVLSRILCRLGFTYKKVLMASEGVRGHP